jgi:hypothetical protein
MNRRLQGIGILTMSECEYQALSQYDNGRQTNSCNRAGNKDICISFCCYLLQALDSSEQHLHNAFEHDEFQDFQESRIHSDTLHANNGTSPHSSSLLDDEMQRVFQVQSCGEMCSHTSCKHEDSSLYASSSSDNGELIHIWLYTHRDDKGTGHSHHAYSGFVPSSPSRMECRAWGLPSQARQGSSIFAAMHMEL